MNELKITLPGSVRSKKNSKRIFARGRFTKVLPSEAYERWEKEARRCASPGSRVAPLNCTVEVEAHFYYRGPKPDLSGCLESVGDALEGLIWANDTLIKSWDGSRLHHDLRNPRTEITVRW